MASGFHRLPMRGFTVFEAAARHGRFTAAADELMITQARVSQHISQLEKDLGVELFVRRSRGVQLTSAGTAFLGTVEQGLKTLADGVGQARRQSGQKTLQILTDYGFAAWWLMPRIAALDQLLPGLEIRLSTTQAEIDAIHAEFDLAIMFGHGDWSGYRTTPLFREEVFPVCAPSYLKMRGGQPTAQEIAAMRLLHLRGTAKARWFTWTDWFSSHGVPSPVGSQEFGFDNYQLVQQAALLGQGVCLGWTPLIDELVTSGHLVRLTTRPLCSRRGYHIVEHADRATTTAGEAVRAWLLAARPEPRLAVATEPARSRHASFLIEKRRAS